MTEQLPFTGKLTVLVRVTLTVMNTVTWGGEGLFHSQFHVTVLIKSSEDRHSRQGRNLQAGADAEAIEEC